MSNASEVLEAAVRAGLRLNTDGEVVLPSGRVSRGSFAADGYRRITIRAASKRATFTYARVVCRLAHGPPPTSDAQVDHISFDTSDDAPGNLRWLTKSENASRVSATTRAARSEMYGNIHRKLSPQDHEEIRRRIRDGARNVDICRDFGISSSHVCYIKFNKGEMRRRGLDPRQD